MPMSRLRNIENTLYYAIFDTLAVPCTQDPLVRLDDYRFSFRYAQLDYLRPVQVYRDNTLLTDGFRINFNERLVIFDAPQPIGTYTANYYYVPVKVLLAFPDFFSEEVVISLPSVAIEYGESYYKPLELGAASKRRAYHQFTIGVFAGNEAEKIDIGEMITDKVFGTTLPLVDYNIAFPLMPDGFLNPGFSTEQQTIGYLTFEDVIHRSFRATKYGDIELHVMLIDVTVVDVIL